jgi:Fic family protein
MNPQHFQAPEAGRVIQAPQGYAAFIPAPLPPKLAFTEDLVLALSRADIALATLAELGRRLPNPHLLIPPYVRREAVLSSRIEGTVAALADVLLDEATSGAASDLPADVREVRNYVTAMEYGVGRLSSLPLSLRLVRELHERLMRGVRGDRATPGEFRRSQTWIGRPGSTLATATYVPPPPQEMEVCLGAWEHFLHERDRLPDLVQCALMHEQFEAIHPFLDGNGRVGRLLITLFLIERGRLSQPLLYLSDYIERHRSEYYEALQRIRTDGDWAGWLRFFLAGVAETAQQGVGQAARLSALRDRLRKRVLKRPKALALLDALFANPFLPVARAEKILRVSNPTARQVVRVLQEEGILREITGRAWGRVYLARAILQAIEGEGAE